MTDPDRSSNEIVTLCRSLGSKSSSEKEKLRRIKLFKAYLQPPKSSASTPEFYDDDVSTLILGSDVDDVPVPGLVSACGEMQLSKNRLSKVAVAALSLMKYLVLDFQELLDGKKIEDVDGNGSGLNVFAETFSGLTRSNIQQMKFDVHLTTMVDSNRGNNAKHKKETCLLVSFLLINHYREAGPDDDDMLDGADIIPDLLALEDVLVTEDSRTVFKGWLSSKDSEAVAIKKLVSKTLDRKSNIVESFSKDENKLANKRIPSKKILTRADENKSEPEWNESEVLIDLSNAPTKWADSKFAHEVAQLFEQDGGAHAQRQTQKEEEDEILEQRAREESIQRELARDPLDIHREDDFDLRLIQARREQLREEIERGILKDYESLGTNAKDIDNSFLSLDNRLKSLSNVERRITIGEDEATRNKVERDASILLTVANFDSLSFLTYAHPSASMGDLTKGLTNIKGRKDNQIEKQEDKVRIHFPLFSRCSQGIDLLGETERENNDGTIPSVQTRMDNIEALVEQSAERAKLSFKPLLDNATEVRKTKTALHVLQKIKPFLDIPNQMKQSIDAEKFGVAINAYRRVMTIDDNYTIDILRSVKRKATEVACEARACLEAIIADPNVPLGKLLDSIYHLGILISWNVASKQTGNSSSSTAYKNMRQALHHSPALGCLVLQANHFSRAVSDMIENAVIQLNLIIERREMVNDKSLAHDTFKKADEAIQKMARSVSRQNSVQSEYDIQESNEEYSKWKHDITNLRVSTVLEIVQLARVWLPRLVRLGVTTRENEVFQSLAKKQITYSAYEAFVGDFADALLKLVQHVSFCSLGSSGSRRKLVMSIGSNLDKEIQAELTTPLPPDLNAACSKELGSLADVVRDCHVSANIMRPSAQEGRGDTDLESDMLRLDSCVSQVNAAVDIAERRVCQNALDACSKHCVDIASSGVLDIDAMRSMVINELATLSNPISCKFEIEGGTRQIIMRACSALSSYASSRDDEASLRVVAECAKALSRGIPDLVREIVDLVNVSLNNDLHQESSNLIELLGDDIIDIEERYFEIYLNSIRKKIQECVRVGWTSEDYDTLFNTEEIDYNSFNFPSYLSRSLLAVVHFKAELFKVFRGMSRKGGNESYEILGITVAAEESIAGICHEIEARFSATGTNRVNMLAAELTFLTKTLDPYLSNDIKNYGLDWIEKLLSKSQNSNPSFITFYNERLDKLGEVYRLSLSFNAAATEL